MTRGPRIQVVLHRDEADAADDLALFAKALARKTFLVWPLQVVEVDTREGAETAVITVQFSRQPRKLKPVI